jgi:hypothetical protein
VDNPHCWDRPNRPLKSELTASAQLSQSCRSGNQQQFCGGNDRVADRVFTLEPRSLIGGIPRLLPPSDIKKERHNQSNLKRVRRRMARSDQQSKTLAGLMRVNDNLSECMRN